MSYKTKLQEIEQRLKQPMLLQELREVCLLLTALLLEREKEESRLEAEVERINSGQWRTGRMGLDKPSVENMEKTEENSEQGKPQNSFEKLL